MERVSVKNRAAAAIAAAIILVQTLIGVSPERVSATDPGIVPGSYIVVYRDDIVAAVDVTELVDAQAGVEVTRVYEHALNGFAADLSPSALRAIRSDPRVAEVVPDRKMYPFAQTFTPGANRIDVDLNPFAGLNGVDERVDADIAILDMGVGPHSDLNVAGGYDCTGQDTTQDNGGHGTHVAGIAAAKDNSSGIVGVAPGTRIWSVKVLDAYDGNWSWVICGIDWVTAHADVIDVANMSLGEDISSANQVFDGPMHQAIQRSVAAGVTYVVAAGNGAGDASTVIPATYEEVITVSAIGDSDGKPGGFGPALSAGPDDHLASFSDFGKDVDIAAPGVDTLSTAPGGGYSVMSGTSFATPHVAGAVALYIAQVGRVGPAAVKAALLATADPGPIPGDPDAYAEGVLNVSRFGGGAISLSASSGQPGDDVTATLKQFPATSSVTLSWDGKEFATLQTDENGGVTTIVDIPAIAKGPHVLSARAGNAFGAITFTVKPIVRLSPAAGIVGTTVKVALRGFGSREQIDVLWKNGSKSTVITTVTASRSGNVNTTLVVPASLGGSHPVTADGNAGSLTKATFTVLPRITLSPASGPPESAIKVSLRGFKSREQVDLWLDTTGGPILLATTTMSSETGSRNITVLIPANALPGAATIRATGNAGTTVSATFTITEPATVASEPTGTAIATATIVESSPTPGETPNNPTLTPEVTPDGGTPASIPTADGPASTPSATVEPAASAESSTIASATPSS